MHTEKLENARILLFWIAAEIDNDMFIYDEAKKIKSKHWNDNGEGTYTLIKCLQKHRIIRREHLNSYRIIKS